MLYNLKAEMIRHNITVTQIANCIGKDEKTVRNKLKGNSAITFPEAVKIQRDFFSDFPMKYLFSDKEAGRKVVS
ncbi:XRE family transcriptional regulator [Bacillus thuringiensis]|uniref:XRE family transcriptional regulator n=1 Tax=Bacillus thuringiensis serovar andalousiensis TaxID=257985 RepID=A0A6H0TDQ6_BACTU|nr:XRE family transcriptional regulator [Bacillus thuringiensis]QIW18559.1 XRE family transcriptional regulator [Bacillus thuringiensis serovar andalousiensis]